MSLAMLAGTLPTITPEPVVPASIVDFLNARYTDAEYHLRCICLEFGSCGGGWCSPGCPTCSGGDQAPRLPLAIIALDELAMQRAILDMHAGDRTHPDPWAHDVDVECTSYGYGDHTIVYENDCPTLQTLAWPHRDHPDYQPRWARYLPDSLTGEHDDEETP